VEAKLTVLSKDDERPTSALQRQGVEKPYNYGPKIRRKLAAGKCLGRSTGLLNLLDTTTSVSQSNFATGVGGFGNLQIDANSGCD
jgi:hypothetical protein